jgi:biotin operon repressor
MTLKDKIIKELKIEPKSMQELQLATGKTEKNIQARISELRKDGYSIELNKVEIQKYNLIEKSNDLKILEFIKDNNLFNSNISISKLSNELSISVSDIKSSIGKLFNNYDIIQLDEDTIMFISK